MSISSPPSTGYVDYQRNVANDGPVLINPPSEITGSWNSGVIPVGQYWGTSTQIQPDTGDFFVQFVWYSDSTLSTPMGEKRIYVSASGGDWFPLVLPNIGPYMSMTIGSVTGAYPVVFSLLTVATNRASVIQTPPVNDLALSVQNAAVAANATDYFYPGLQYAGPVNAWFYTSQSGTFSLQVWNGATWQLVQQVIVTNGGQETLTMTVPLSSWRIAYANGVGAASIYATLTPSVTGST